MKVLSLFVIFLAPMSCFDFTGFQHLKLWNQQTDGKPDFDLYYEIKENFVTLGAKVSVSDKWFGVGLSSSGGMIGADIAIFSPKG